MMKLVTEAKFKVLWTKFVQKQCWDVSKSYGLILYFGNFFACICRFKVVLWTNFDKIQDDFYTHGF